MFRLSEVAYRYNIERTRIYQFISARTCSISLLREFFACSSLYCKSKPDMLFIISSLNLSYYFQAALRWRAARNNRVNYLYLYIIKVKDILELYRCMKFIFICRWLHYILKKRSNSSEMHLCQKRKEATSALTLKSIWSNKKKDNTTNRSRKTKNWLWRWSKLIT
jgi:hypothetical protein